MTDRSRHLLRVLAVLLLVQWVAALVGLSRTTLANIHQNVAIALGLKAVFLVATVIGVTGLWPAVLADTGATVLVAVNVLRLLRYRFDEAPSHA
jgi:Cd2+/Zn2+-exporting ATPase